MLQERVLAALGVVALVAIAGGGIALALGGDEQEPSVLSAGATVTSTTAVVVTTPTTLPASTTTTSPAADQTTVTVGIVCTTPEDASNALVNAWKGGDRTAAARCASASAVDTIFQSGGQDAAWAFEGCPGADPGVPECAFTYPGGTARLTLNGTEAEGWKVVEVQLAA
jgi:hypothetical protein